MTRRRHHEAIDREGLAALAAFARGYLHEDVIAEHGSAAGAVRAFCEDATDDERRRLAEDLSKLSDAASGWPAARLARFFTDDLRAAWTPASAADVRALAAIAQHAGDRSGST